MILKYAISANQNKNNAVARYNGAGPAAEKYSKLVANISSELKTPQNKELVDLFNLLLQPVGDE
jgi:hypothetical protein